MTVRNRQQPARKVATRANNQTASARVPEPKMAKLTQVQGGLGVIHRPEARRTPVEVASKPIPIKSSPPAVMLSHRKGGKVSRTPVGRTEAPQSDSERGNSRPRVKGRLAKHEGPSTIRHYIQTSGSEISSRAPCSVNTTAFTEVETAINTTINTAINTPRGMPKSQGVQVSALTLQLQSLAVDESSSPNVTDDRGANVEAIPPDFRTFSSVTENGTSSGSASENELNSSYHQDILGSTYEVQIDHDFVSSKAIAKTPVEAGENFSPDKPSTSKMSADDFEPLKYLGKGGFGTVVLVKQKATGRLYAQKQLRKESLLVYTRNAESAKTERNVLESINRHPFMVTLYYAFQDEAKLYLMLEYAQGGELFHHLSEQRMFPESTVAFYTAEMVLALEFLHNKTGVVYRDLKPENCLLDAEGHLLLTDFGLCKELDDGIRCNTMTGTRDYMAPEVIKGEEYGFSVDWWSLGAIGVELLTGSPPFSGSNDTAVRHKIVTAALRLPFYVGPYAKDIFIRLLRKDPKKRLGSSMPGDMDTIKNHGFFRKIDWKRLYKRELEPPIRPFITDPALAENFDDEFTGIPVTPSDTNFRSKLDDTFYKSQNPSPAKPKKKQGKTAKSKEEGQPPSLMLDMDDDGQADDEKEEDGGENNSTSGSDTDGDDDPAFDPDSTFGGFSFTAEECVFDEADFWIS